MRTWAKMQIQMQVISDDVPERTADATASALQKPEHNQDSAAAVHLLEGQGMLMRVPSLVDGVCHSQQLLGHIVCLRVVC